ncbi:hypothetical protein Tco_1103835 [Tanacetum coccineum]
MSSYNGLSCYLCGDPLDGILCRRCSCEWCGNKLNDGFCSYCASKDGNSFAYDPNPNSFDNSPNFSYPPPQPQFETYSCELCGNDSHYGYDCPSRVPLVYEPEPCYNQNYSDNYYLQNSPSFSQQYLCCAICGGPHYDYQCQQINETYYEPNPIYDSSGFDQPQPPQDSVDCQKALDKILEELEEIKRDRRKKIEDMSEKIDEEYERDCEIRIRKLKQDFNEWGSEVRKKEQAYNEEQYSAARRRMLYIPFVDEDDSILLRDIIARYSSSVAITSSPPVLPTREPEDSLIMGDEHLNTIPEKESDELIKSSVENLVPIPSKSEVTFDNESECDMPVCDDFTTFSNPLFDSNDDFTASDDESLFDEDVLMKIFKIYSNPFFDNEEIISPKIDPHYFNAESNLIESLLNRDILIDSSPKFDYLLEEFSGELAYIDPIPLGIEKVDFNLKEEIRFVENLLYDNSSSRPPKELNLEIADTILESLYPYPILFEDSDSHIEEIDLFLASDDSMPPGIKNGDYDSERDIHFLEELLSNNFPPLLENESSNLDHFNDPSPSRPPPKPLDVEICFDFKPDTGVVTNKVVGDISEHDVLMPNILPTQPTLCLVFDLLLPFSSENEDKVFNPGILISPLLSHRGEITSNFYKSPMMISGGDIPLLDVSYLYFYPL